MAGSSSWDNVHQVGTVLNSSRPRQPHDVDSQRGVSSKAPNYKVSVTGMEGKSVTGKSSPNNTPEDPAPARLVGDVVVVQDRQLHVVDKSSQSHLYI